jgi:regulator of replication initiation timing
MSNIAKTIQYLKDSPTNRFIKIINSATNNKVGKTDVYLDDITNEDLTAYIKHNLGSITQPTFVYVECRIKDGSTSRKKDGYSLEIQPEGLQPQLPVPVNYPAVMQQPQVQPDFFHTGGLGATLGLGFPQIMEMQRKSDRLTDKEEQLAELKEDFKELKQENRLLEIDNRELKTKLSTSEAKQEMAVLMVKAENKSFFDSPAFEKVMEQAPQILAGIASMKTGGVATGALGNPSLSATHNELIDYISSNLDENQANYIGSICGLMGNPTFQQELKSLITRYATV